MPGAPELEAVPFTGLLVTFAGELRAAGLAVGSGDVLTYCSALSRLNPADLVDLSLELAAWMIYLGGAAASVEEARKLSAKLIGNGEAFKKFGEIVRLQGGNEKALDDLSLLPQAQNRVDIASAEAGFRLTAPARGERNP